MNVLVDIARGVLLLYLTILFLRLIFDYVFAFARSWRPTGPLVILLEIIYSLTDPPLKLLRRIIPTLRLGNFNLDLAFLVLVLLIYVLLSVLQQL